MKKNIIIILFTILTISSIFGQDWGLSMDFEPFPFRFGLGPGFEDSYGVIIPEKETIFELLGGYEFDSQSWYGLGEDFTQLDNAEQTNSVFYNNAYARLKLGQILFGDRYHLDYYLEAGIEHISRFMVPMPASYLPYMDDKNIYQSDRIVGDKMLLNHSPLVYLYFQWLDHDFWTTSGFSHLANLSMNIGSETDWQYWSMLSTKQNFNAWLPLAGQYLFFHLNATADLIINSFGQSLPYFIYPALSGNRVRHMEHAYFDHNIVSGSIELISRFLNFELLWPMSLGLGTFFDTGTYSRTFSSIDIQNLFMSCGAFIEYKVAAKFFFDINLTLHFGMASRITENQEGNTILNPEIYFSIR